MASVTSFSRIRTPLFDKIEDLVGALVRPFGTSTARKQTRDPQLLKCGLRCVERLPADTKCDCNLGHRLSVDLVMPQHLITNLHEIAGVKELTLAERFVVHRVRMRMERSLSAECLGFGINGTARVTCF